MRGWVNERGRGMMWRQAVGDSRWVATDSQCMWVDFLYVDSHFFFDEKMFMLLRTYIFYEENKGSDAKIVRL